MRWNFKTGNILVTIKVHGHSVHTYLFFYCFCLFLFCRILNSIKCLAGHLIHNRIANLTSNYNSFYHHRRVQWPCTWFCWTQEKDYVTFTKILLSSGSSFDRELLASTWWYVVFINNSEIVNSFTIIIKFKDHQSGFPVISSYPAYLGNISAQIWRMENVWWVDIRMQFFDAIHMSFQFFFFRIHPISLVFNWTRVVKITIQHFFWCILY